MHDTLTSLGFPADLEDRMCRIPATIAAPAAALLADANDADRLAREAKTLGDDDLGDALYRKADTLARRPEVHAMMDALEPLETLGSCGCTDYHVSDCPTRG